MSAKKFIVELDAAERERLNALISKGKAPAKMILKARILLKADISEGAPGWLDDQILKALDTNLTMVSRVRETFVLKGLDAVQTRKGKPVFTQLRPISAFSKETVEEYAKANLTTGSRVLSDGLGFWNGLDDAGMKHEPRVTGSGRPKDPDFK